MELFLLYFWLKLDLIAGWLAALNAALVILLVVFQIISIEEAGDYKYSPVHKGKKYIAAAFLFLAFNIGLPSKTDVAILVGANYAFKAAETPEAEKVMKLLRTKANQMLDEEIAKVTAPKKEK